MNDVKIVCVTKATRTDSYHHGDLSNALADAATELARAGGPDAVVLREAARRVGVSPASAYHHFANRAQLVQAVKQRALTSLTEQMQSAVAPSHDAATDARSRRRDALAETARRRLRAIGCAYLQFAFDEPGLFRLTFGPQGPWPTDEPALPHSDNVGPFGLLRQVLDELVAAGAVPPERRPGLEYVAWAEVHGVAALCLDGPLARVDPAQRQATIDHALDSIIRGL